MRSCVRACVACVRACVASTIRARAHHPSRRPRASATSRWFLASHDSSMAPSRGQGSTLGDTRARARRFDRKVNRHVDSIRSQGSSKVIKGHQNQLFKKKEDNQSSGTPRVRTHGVYIHDYTHENPLKRQPDLSRKDGAKGVAAGAPSGAHITRECRSVHTCKSNDLSNRGNAKKGPSRARRIPSVVSTRVVRTTRARPSIHSENHGADG